MDKNAVAATMRSYDDFEPFCTWKREEGQETLVVHLPEFQRDQLKVYISNLAVVRITGARCADGMKWNRFTKEIKIPKDCDANEIHAEFRCGLLYITMPKKITSAIKPEQPTSVKSKKPTLDETTGSFKKKIKLGMAFSVAKSISGQKVAMNGVPVVVGAAAMVLALIGAYATCKYWCSNVSAGPSHALNM